MKQSKKKGRKPAHQNEFAFVHNANSRLTKKILAMPNEGLCRRCHDKIEWRKKYRKYKPLKQPRKCNFCHNKAVKAAYHVVCKPCAAEKSICAWCCTTWEKLRLEELNATAEQSDEGATRVDSPQGQKGDTKKGGNDPSPVIEPMSLDSLEDRHVHIEVPIKDGSRLEDGS